MIDKLTVRIPEGTPFTREFDSLFNTYSLKPTTSRHYKFVADLRPFAYDSILHYACRHGKEHNHKLELVDTGSMTLVRMMDEIQQVFQVDAAQVSVMRIDLAVDVEGIGVAWFAEHTRVGYKRWLAKIGVIDAVEMGNREIQTLYFGKRPNVIRIYDKIAEYRMQYQRAVRLMSPELQPAPFEACFGVPESGVTLTRVERQIGGSRIPAQVATVSDLQNSGSFNPFDAVEFVSGGKPEPNPNDYTFMEYSTGMYLRHLAETRGMQAANSYITRLTKRNKSWAFRKFHEFLPPVSEHDLTRERLFELYQRSIAAQFQPVSAA